MLKAFMEKRRYAARLRHHMPTIRQLQESLIYNLRCDILFRDFPDTRDRGKLSYTAGAYDIRVNVITPPYARMTTLRIKKGDAFIGTLVFHGEDEIKVHLPDDGDKVAALDAFMAALILVAELDQRARTLRAA